MLAVVRVIVLVIVLVAVLLAIMPAAILRCTLLACVVLLHAPHLPILPSVVRRAC